jgi:hypothetical protein
MSDEKKHIEDAVAAGKEYFGKERWNYSGEYSGFRHTWIDAFVLASNKKQEELEHKLALAIETLESISVKEYHCLCNHICKEVLEKLK